MRTFHERYIGGEFEQVWDEMCSLGSDVREPTYFDDVTAVARETMRRVRLNCEMLIPRLQSLGWRFGYEWASTSDWAQKDIARHPPLLSEPTSTVTLDNIEARIGLLPVSLRAFYEIVGAINFVGTPFDRPNWPGVVDGLDPLYVAGVEQGFERMQDTHGQEPCSTHSGDAFEYPLPVRVEVAPDFLQKYFISGVGSEYIEIPSENADVTLMFEDGPLQIGGKDLTFVRNLRFAMHGGGFLAFMPGSVWNVRPDDDLAFLTDGLRPI
ncbi:MAG TPA: hypothetical protein VM409_04445 [Chloroflexia bacterium]|nr:hypothetical protein [Chloroflexia bacterium]